jgi:hypothetical protein
VHVYLFLLEYINHAKMGFIICITHLCVMWFDHIHPIFLYCSPSPFCFHLFFPNSPLSIFIPSQRRLDSTDERKHALLSFWVWLISLNMMLTSSIHFTANDIILFFFMAATQ